MIDINTSGIHFYPYEIVPRYVFQFKPTEPPVREPEDCCSVTDYICMFENEAVPIEVIFPCHLDYLRSRTIAKTDEFFSSVGVYLVKENRFYCVVYGKVLPSVLFIEVHCKLSGFKYTKPILLKAKNDCL